MNISTKGRYGLRALIDLALCSTGEPIALYSIANRQGLSVNYLEQIFSMLRKEGIVKSIKGAQGGYILAEEAANIKVGDILRAIEGEIILVNETIDEANADSSIKYLQLCIQKNVWDKINDSINTAIDHITLEDLASKYRLMNIEESNMYYI